MTEPTLVIMAAGMGSRFGGLKQVAPVDRAGHPILAFSLYDAWRAGFRQVAFVIKRELETEFRERVGRHAEERFQVLYVFQDLDRLPAGFQVPVGRVKPWGTGHAVACCQGMVTGPFAVINADDFYGPSAFSAVYSYLIANAVDNRYAMVGYRLRNTVTEHGSVSRGICQVRDGFLSGITERTELYKRGDHAAYTEDGKTFVDLPGDTLVSMNFWGFSPSIFHAARTYFKAFLHSPAGADLKAECLLPVMGGGLLGRGALEVNVLPSYDRWFGMTYRQDRETVAEELRQLHAQGVYPGKLWN